MRIRFSGISAFIVAALLAVACGPQGDDSSSTHESVVSLGSFSSYVTEFQQKAETLGVHIVINDLIVRFGPMTSPLERGYCETGSNRTPLIVVDQNYWEQSSEESRKSLLLHELGHCVLRRAHLATLMNTGVPASLMNPYTIPANVFEYNEIHYWEELYSVMNTM